LNRPGVLLFVWVGGLSVVCVAGKGAIRLMPAAAFLSANESSNFGQGRVIPYLRSQKTKAVAVASL